MLKEFKIEDIASLQNSTGVTISLPMAETLSALFAAFAADRVPPEMLNGAVETI